MTEEQDDEVEVTIETIPLQDWRPEIGEGVNWFTGDWYVFGNLKRVYDGRQKNKGTEMAVVIVAGFEDSTVVIPLEELRPCNGSKDIEKRGNRVERR